MIQLDKGMIALDGREVQYTLRRSVKARYLHFEINASEGLVVVAPKRWSTGTLSALIEGKKRWILKNIDRYAAYVHPFDKGYLEQGDRIPYLGRELEVVFDVNYGHADGIMLDNNRLLLQPNEQDNSTVVQVVKRWLRNQATAFLPERVGELATKLDLTYTRVSIRGQKSRWGSCSSKKNINLNWKLIMTPLHIIDYTIIHELLHLRQMNHSKAFWDLVAGYYPDWCEYRKWLKEHAGYLLVDA